MDVLSNLTSLLLFFCYAMIMISFSSFFLFLFSFYEHMAVFLLFGIVSVLHFCLYLWSSSSQFFLGSRWPCQCGGQDVKIPTVSSPSSFFIFVTVFQLWGQSSGQPDNAAVQWVPDNPDPVVPTVPDRCSARCTGGEVPASGIRIDRVSRLGRRAGSTSCDLII